MKVWMVRGMLRGLTFIALLALAAGLWGQATGSITGTVTDQSGSVIPGATVTVTDAAQNVPHVTVTNAKGAYLVGGLSGGTYNISIAAKGFAKYQANGVVLHISEQIRADAQLKVGSVNSEVTVSGTSIGQIQTENASLSGTVTGNEVRNLELNGRNFTQLITLVPGVSNQTGQDEGPVGVSGSIAYSVNGGRTEYNNWEVDGANVMDNGSNSTINVYPSIDAIGHVRVLTSNYGAQYGRDASGTVQADTKSGGNAWHGDAYEFLRNQNLNARSFFDSTRPVYRKNDYGYTLGGPIVKNKTFIFWSEEWRKQSNPSTFNTLVPTTAERAGNFSADCPGPNCPVNPATGAAFPNNVVPIAPAAAPLLAMIPSPTGSGANSDIYNASVSEPTNWREELFRVDQTFNPTWSAYFRFIHDSWDTVSVPTLWGSGTFPNIPTSFVGPGVDMVAHLATTVSPTLLNEFTADYTSDHIGLLDSGPIALPSGYPLAGLFANGFGGKLPSFSLGSTPDASFGVDTGDEPWNNSNPTYGLRDQVSQVMGNHALYYGFDFTAAQKNEMGGQEVQPSLSFSTSSSITTGNALADMFIGQIASMSQSNIQPKYYDRYKTFAPYFQDDWHATSRLTLNLGLRLDMMGTYYDLTKGANTNFEPSAYSLATAPIINANGDLAQNPNSTTPVNFFDGLVTCGQGGAPRGCIQGHLWNFAPRFGFAYNLDGRGVTAIRGGYGVFYDHTNGNEAADQLRNPPLGLSPAIPNIVGYPTTTQAGGAFGPLGVGAIPSAEEWPYVQQWNLDVEHQFWGNTVVTTSYVGSKGTHLTDLRDLNQLHPTPAGSNPYKAGQTLAADCATDNAAGFYSAGGSPQAIMANGQTIAPGNPVWVNMLAACGNSIDSVRPFVGYGDISLVDQGANSIYNALQVSARRNVKGLDLNLAYTYSHSIDDASDRYDTSFVNSYDIEAARASSNFDQRHMLSLAWVYNLPWGGNNAWVGGWEWSGIMTLETGTPFSVTNGTDNAGVGNGIGTGSRPDVVGDPNSVGGNPNADSNAGDAGSITGPLLFNTAAFAAPTGLTFGTAPRNELRNPGRENFDMGVFKEFHINESRSVQLRVEGFNVFNKVNWTGVNAGFGNSYGANVGSLTLRPSGAHLGRVLQLGLKFVF